MAQEVRRRCETREAPCVTPALQYQLKNKHPCVGQRLAAVIYEWPVCVCYIITTTVFSDQIVGMLITGH